MRAIAGLRAATWDCHQRLERRMAVRGAGIYAGAGTNRNLVISEGTPKRLGGPQ
jgi:hypothetical protein